jgi:serine/threonine-protein kinase RsbW
MKKELIISSKIENISLIENLIDETSVELSLVADLYGNLLIATIEGVTNAIVHGNKLDEFKKVSVIISLTGNKLCVQICDEGKGFSFDNIPDPTKPDNVEKPDGRGIFLMRNLADNIEFENNGAIVKLFFKI